MTPTLEELDRIVSNLAPERQARYRQLVESARDTPLLRLNPETSGLPHHDVYLKLEFENDVGCHHRRLYPFVFALYEAEGKIVPGRTPVVEASVGGAACAFAYCARFLGFDRPRPPLAVVQWNASPARLGKLRDFGAEIHRAPVGDRDVTVAELRRVLARDRERVRRHGGERLYCTTKIKRGAEVAYGAIVEELQRAGVRPDILLSVVGSGASMSGIGRALKRWRPEARIYVVEHERARVNSALARGRIISFAKPPHDYHGAGHWGVPPRLLNIDFSLVDGFVAFSDEEAEGARKRVLEAERVNLGLTTSGCVAALSKLPMEETAVARKNIIIVAYDTYETSRLGAAESARAEQAAKPLSPKP